MSTLSGLQYPHWLIVAGIVLVIIGFVGFAFHPNRGITADDDLNADGK
jgi:hypothetical protein